MALINPVAVADMEFDALTRLTVPLVAEIIAHQRALGTCEMEQRLVRIATKKVKRRRVSKKLPEKVKRCLILEQEKGASSWLRVKPL